MIKKLGDFCVTIGAQWGDEGKGKLVDILAKEYDIVARAAGGANAGHTIEVEDEKFIFHLVPSGVIQGKTCIIGNGCVIHLPTLLDEIKTLNERDITVKGKLFISERAHILFDFHKQLDQMQEESKGDNKIGSTKRGIGPAYTSKISRSGLRMGTLIYDFNFFERKLRELANELNAAYDLNIDTEAELILYATLRETFKDLVIDTSKFLYDEMRKGKTVIAEGAQGAMLDIDHGTYPYVTSSNTCIGGTCAGLGIAPTKITSVLGIVKAYTTRVGGGIFPTELLNEDGDRLREVGHEFGATTGRPRRCGWLDIVQLKAANRVNGITHINLTKLDVLSGMKELKVAVKYSLNGKEIFDIPLSENDQEKLDIEYGTFDGWDEDITSCEKYEDLPKNAKKYIEAIEKMLEVKVNFIGVGPKRSQIIEKK